MTNSRPKPFVTTIHIAGFAARIVVRVASDPAVSWSPRSPRFNVDFDEMQRRLLQLAARAETEAAALDLDAIDAFARALNEPDGAARFDELSGAHDLAMKAGAAKRMEAATLRRAAEPVRYTPPDMLP